MWLAECIANVIFFSHKWTTYLFVFIFPCFSFEQIGILVCNRFDECSKNKWKKANIKCYDWLECLMCVNYCFPSSEQHFCLVTICLFSEFLSVIYCCYFHQKKAKKKINKYEVTATKRRMNQQKSKVVWWKITILVSRKCINVYFFLEYSISIDLHAV